MNPQERLRVARLVTRLAEQPDMPKDKDAALELEALMKVRPDAPYLLMQRALMLELALEQAQLELEQLRQSSASSAGWPQPRLAPSRLSTGFNMMPGLGSWRRTGTRPSAGGGFLRNAAAVGAGVLGGSLLFQGLENLFDGEEHHHHYGDAQGPAGLQDMGFTEGSSFDAGSLGDAGGFGLDHDDWV